MYSPIGIAAAKRVITNDEFKKIFRNAGNLYLENNSSVNIQKMKRVIKNGIKNVLNIADNCFADKYAYSFQSLESGGKAVMTYIIIPLVYTLKITNSTLYSKFIGGEDYTPLYALIPEITKRGFFMKFFMNSTERQLVEVTNAFIEERLKKLYDAIFVDEYENHENSIVGEMEFSSISKKYILDEIKYF